MNKAIAITDSIYWVGVNDKETDIFESLWPLPNGVAYNSYLMLGEKTALIDTVHISYQDDFLDKIKDVLGEKELDYLVINHMEPDHSGSIRALKQAFPNLQIVGNEKTAKFLKGFYNIEEIKVIKDQETIDLGNRKLTFYLTPMVHWPETMMTYDTKDKMLFAGDAFGGFGAFHGGIFDDEIDIDFYEDEIRRYFANIVAKYSPMVQKAYAKLSHLDLQIIASTHGPIWRENPQYIIDTYVKYSSYDCDEGVVIVYGSMYGNTKKMAQEIARGVSDGGVKKIRLYDASRTHISYLLSDIWKYKGMILGACTYNNELFPPVAALTSALENRRMKNHILGIFGSYSWSGGAVKDLRAFNDKLKYELVEPVVEAQYSPDDDILEDCYRLGQNMAKKIKESL
ncbi:FprA family A-type flavoprotein [Natronospora cellulosivora (SeqCode)]